MEQVNNHQNEEEPEASGTSSETITSADLAARYNAIFHPSVDNSSCELSQNSRMMRLNVKKFPKMMKLNIPDVRKLPETTKQRRPENSPLLT